MKKPSKVIWRKADDAGHELCCDLPRMIGATVISQPTSHIWFVEEARGTDVVRILAHGSATTIAQAKAQAVKAARTLSPRK